MAGTFFRTSLPLLIATPALGLMRPPFLWRGAVSPAVVRLSASMVGSERQSKRQMRRKRFDSKRETSTTVAAIKEAMVAGSEGESNARQRINELTRLNQPQKVLQLFNATAEDEQGEVLPLVMRSLLKMRCIEAALELQSRHVANGAVPLDTRSAVTLFLALCRTNRLDEATTMLANLEHVNPPPAEAEAVAAVEAALATGDAAASPDEPMWHAISSTMMPALALARIESNDADTAGAEDLAARFCAQPAVAMPPDHMLTRLVRQFGRHRSFRGVFACLDAEHHAARSDASHDWQQAMIDAIVRSVKFVKGGVSMSTLPPAPYPEIALVGRSNVGKSSLTNFFVGRRAIAYTSKTPGKTQQYNYFLINGADDSPSRGRRRAPSEGVDDESAWRAAGTFHLVDMPGLGFAKVPGADRKRWLSFLQTYARERPQLKMIVHLIDGQVGPLETDRMLMEMVRDAAEDEVAAAVAQRRHAREQGGDDAELIVEERTPLDGVFDGGGAGKWQYAIVLTKVDKGGIKAVQRAEAMARKAVEETGCPEPVAIVVTSASKRVGRGDMWRLMRGVVMSDDS